jgi:hypothetical protein
MIYYGLEHTNKLLEDQMVIAKCPEWSDSGYQIAFWNGEEFFYDDQPNEMFNDDVIAFLPLTDDGEPDDWGD